jgi:hypothetical protein
MSMQSQNMKMTYSPAWWSPAGVHCDQVHEVHLNPSFAHSLLEDLPCGALVDPAIALLSILQSASTKPNEIYWLVSDHKSWFAMALQVLLGGSAEWLIYSQSLNSVCQTKLTLLIWHSVTIEGVSFEVSQHRNKLQPLCKRSSQPRSMIHRCLRQAFLSETLETSYMGDLMSILFGNDRCR